ncbi:hypothetical protein GZH47_05390 [Paenibacillus rhizovicinus]|uniref:Peptidase A4 family protein n=1 Tax=Paenibacillus rhizovicinus TaxID=2704463 RepID=A0A6C0P0T8_9BACL|nr:G1 family glutamic endopeptidase [Paenibacillus rhizovicinus]QHW30332.1 hypothetical protein GZH47_05390 [Paenibacillus rhizovicinus]
MKKILFLICSVLLLLSGNAFADPGKVESGMSVSNVTSAQGNDEQTIVIHEPPANWNALNASDEELAYYFYPPRPTDPSQLKDWKKVVSGKWEKPKFEKGKTSKFQAGISNSTNVTYYNWSGVISKQTAGRATAFWSSPSVSADSTHRPAFFSSWIGLGGSASSGEPLFQAGIAAIIDASGSVAYSPFYEVVNTNVNSDPMYLSSTQLSFSPGDTVYADISYTPGASNGHFDMYMSHGSTIFSFSVTNIHYSSAVTSAEWIAEKPTLKGQSIDSVNLAKFSQVTFSRAAMASSPSGTANLITASPSSTQYVYMKNSSGTALASPTAIGTNGDFNVVWAHY